MKRAGKGKTARRAKPTTTKARTARELAKALGRAPSTVSGWMRDDRWRFGRTGPFDIAAVKAWADRTLMKEPGADDDGGVAAVGRVVGVEELGPERRAKLAILLEKHAVLKLEREVKAGLVHRADQCERHRVQRVLDLRNAFLAFESRLSRILANRPEEGVRQILNNEIRALLDAFAKGEPWPPEEQLWPPGK